MTATAATEVAAPISDPAQEPSTQRRLTAFHLLVLYAALLLLVPSELVVPQIGSAGTPANLLGLCFLLWWVCAKLASHLTGRVTPMHVVLGLLLVCVLLSFANGLATGWIRPAAVHQKTDAVWTLLPITQGELFDKSVLGATRGLIAIGAWIGTALLIIDGLRSWREADAFVNAIVWLTSVVGVVGIYQYFSGDNLARFVQVPGLSPTYEIGGADYPRIPYGSEADDWGAERQVCHDCCARKGQLHVPGCDVECCPRCKGQAISCDCLEDEDP